VRRKRHAAHEEEHENHERWLITYADMITLLMAFFIMMYAMSILDIKKFDQFKAGVATQLGKSPVIVGGQGILQGGTGVANAAAPPIGGSPDGGTTVPTDATGDVPQGQLHYLVDEIHQRLQDAHLEGTVQVEIDPARGLVVYVKDRVFFASGQAAISIEGRSVLDQLAAVLAHIDNTIVVEGHTDDRPIASSMFPSNWELSTARATQVLRMLVESHGLPAPRFSAAGYADTRPRVPNDTPAHRGTNRRVEIVIVAHPEEIPNGQVSN
jgi:chemotaxis protein MotB